MTADPKLEVDMNGFRIAEDLTLPLDAVTARLGFTGQSESGKTYSAMKLAELMLHQGAQIIAMDPVGVWWGLKAGKDQRTPGLPVVVFGGVHADMPIAPDGGKIIAETLARSAAPAVLDLSEFTMGELAKFTAGFAESFFLAKRLRKGPVCIFWEEAQSFAPQELPPDPHAALMLNRVVRVVKVGRNYGIGNVLVTQEPQAVSKRALGQVNCLFIGQMQGPDARKAIARWLDDKATRASDLDIVAELTTLKVGDAFVAEPRWFGPPRRIHVLPKETFDSSATPKFGETAAKPGKLASVDITELRSALAEMVSSAEKDDPIALRRRIVELEVELRRESVAFKPLVAPAVRVEVPVLGEDQLKRLTAAVEQVEATAKTGESALATVMDELVAIRKALDGHRPRPVAAFQRSKPNPVLAEMARPATATVHNDARGGMPKGELTVLTAVAQHSAGVTRPQLTVVTGYKRSTRDLNVGNLRRAGLIEPKGERLHVTAAGRAALGPSFRPLPTGDALLQHWRGELPAGELAVLEVAVAKYPETVTRDEISEATGYKRSTRDLNIQRLRARHLLTDEERASLRASEALFS